MPIRDLLEIGERCAGAGSDCFRFGLATRLQEFIRGHDMHLSGALRNVNSRTLIHSVSDLLLTTAAMDVYEIRRHNLNVLRAEAESLKAIGDAMVRVVQARGKSDRAPDYQNVLSQHVGGKRMGAKMARLVEEAMKKSKGWMDTMQQADQTMEAKEAGQIAMNIAEADKREMWLSLGRALAQQGGAGNPYGGVPKGKKGTQ